MTSQRQQGGSQKDWDEVRKHSDLPIITIITSTYNVVQDLQWTIDSIKKQTYPNTQWIIADGASTDGTIAILEANNELIDYWLSEPDTGIYEAWNKALEHVKGDWVQFIGAGDELYENSTLEKVAPYLKSAYPNYELVYGQVMHISEKGRKKLYVSGEPWENYKGKWEGNRPKLPPHPAVFHHKNIFIKQKFNTRLKIVSDSDFLLKNIDKNFLYIPYIVNRMPSGGISSTITGIMKSYEELNYVMKYVDIKTPFLVKAKSYIRYQISKKGIYILSEEKYKKLLNVTKRLRGKADVFTNK